MTTKPSKEAVEALRKLRCEVLGWVNRDSPDKALEIIDAAISRATECQVETLANTIIDHIVACQQRFGAPITTSDLAHIIRQHLQENTLEYRVEAKTNLDDSLYRLSQVCGHPYSDGEMSDKETVDYATALIRQNFGERRHGCTPVQAHAAALALVKFVNPHTTVPEMVSIILHECGERAAEPMQESEQASGDRWAKQYVNPGIYYLHNVSALPPGGPEAHLHGCNCPSIDNNHGEGYHDGTGVKRFVTRDDCPLHGKIKAAAERSLACAQQDAADYREVVAVQKEQLEQAKKQFLEDQSSLASARGENATLKACNESLAGLTSRVWKAVEPTGEYEGDEKLIQFCTSLRERADRLESECNEYKQIHNCIVQLVSIATGKSKDEVMEAPLKAMKEVVAESDEYRRKADHWEAEAKAFAMSASGELKESKELSAELAEIKHKYILAMEAAKDGQEAVGELVSDLAEARKRHSALYSWSLALVARIVRKEFVINLDQCQTIAHARAKAVVQSDQHSATAYRLSEELKAFRLAPTQHPSSTPVSHVSHPLVGVNKVNNHECPRCGEACSCNGEDTGGGVIACLHECVGPKGEEERLPTIEEMSGCINDFTGGQTLREFLDDMYDDEPQGEKP